MRARATCLLALAVAVLLVRGAAQTAGQAIAQPTTSVLVDPAVADSYRLGPGDLVAISVFGSPELSRAVRVDTEGRIRMPYGETQILAAGRNVDELRQAVAQALVADKLAVDPRVEISVKEIQSEPIVVSGAVRTPLTIEPTRPMRLLEALTRAGGISDPTAEHILVSRQDSSGIRSHDYPASKVLSGDDAQFNPELTGGEEVRVLPGGRVYVVGGFKTPGALPFSESDPLTLIRVLTYSGGWTTTSKPHQAVIMRTTKTGRHEIPVDLTKVLARKAPDLTLASNDVIYLPDDTTKKVGLEILERAAGALTMAAGTLLVR
ncbi:MAG: polysaccharide biosynthesis/export family protein [Terriglobales bacterium]